MDSSGSIVTGLQIKKCGVINPEGVGEFSPEHADPTQRPPVQRASSLFP
jgi:hypothetical protein